MHYHAIPFNTMQYYAIQCNTMQYHSSLISADGAYHCPVGSIWPFFHFEIVFNFGSFCAHRPFWIGLKWLFRRNLTFSEVAALGFTRLSFSKENSQRICSQLFEIFLFANTGCPKNKKSQQKQNSRDKVCRLLVIEPVQCTVPVAPASFC